MSPDARPRSEPALRWCLPALAALALGAQAAGAQALQQRAKESGCTDAPRIVDGTTNLYRCNTSSGAAAIFNVEANGDRTPPPRRTANNSTPPLAPAAPVQTTPGLPRVDAATQKGRDDLRRRVLQEELSAEEKLLVEARAAYANGAPPALPEERAQPARYAERIARLRDVLLRHERNIEMLRRELSNLR